MAHCILFPDPHVLPTDLITLSQSDILLDSRPSQVAANSTVRACSPGTTPRSAFHRNRWLAAWLVLSLLCIATRSAHAVSPIPMPIEVMGVAGTTRTVTVTIPPQPSGSAPSALWLQVHGLGYENKAAVQVNSGAWQPLNNATVTLVGPAKSYGGIGGGFSTLKMTIPLSSGLAHTGQNTIGFRFLQTDGVSSGFRVLAFNFLSQDGSFLLPSSTFVQDDPSLWQPPLNSSTSINAGKTLWQSAPLIGSSLPGASTIKAHCGDCHARDGRDLKYFNYSNLSIIERAKFHGLTPLQGQQIASYIRSLNQPSPGRPWNPPYQPGPGIDSQPMANWSAGAGIDAVLDTDSQTLSYLFPQGISQSVTATNGHLNARETPLAMQFPDWNHWLPRIHPIDAWGNDFVSSNLLKKYDGSGSGSSTWNFRSRLSQGTDAYMHTSGGQALNDFGYWGNDRFLLLNSEISTIYNSTLQTYNWTPQFSEAVYATALWQLVKTWEMVQEFRLEGYGQTLYGSYGEPRTWFVDFPFRASPFQLHIPSSQNGIGGSALTNEYISSVWYQVQLVLNDSNYRHVSSYPIDWPYVYGKLKDLNTQAHEPEAMRMVLYLIKGMQISDNGVGPDQPLSGWRPDSIADVSRLVHPAWAPMWRDTDASTRAAIMTAMVASWFNKTSQYSPAQYYTGGLASPNYVPTGWYDGALGDKVLYMIPQLRANGVDGALLNQIADWAQTVWPKGAWATVRK